MPRLLGVGHGTLAAEQLARLLGSAGVELIVDVRIAPTSRRHPQFCRDQLERCLPEVGVGYRWEKALGGHRKTRPGSRHVALRHAGFRGYADHMETEAFSCALDLVIADAEAMITAVMCAESLWWRCHRRLLADAAVARGAEVRHLHHDGHLALHRLTTGARLEGTRVIYDMDVAMQEGKPQLPGLMSSTGRAQPARPSAPWAGRS